MFLQRYKQSYRNMGDNCAKILEDDFCCLLKDTLCLLLATTFLLVRHYDHNGLHQRHIQRKRICGPTQRLTNVHIIIDSQNKVR